MRTFINILFTALILVMIDIAVSPYDKVTPSEIPTKHPSWYSASGYVVESHSEGTAIFEAAPTADHAMSIEPITRDWKITTQRAVGIWTEN